MGGFFLHHRRSNANIPSSQKVFERMGFGAPKTFEFSDWSLLLYEKVGISLRNFIEDGQQGFFCIGTFSYKKLGYANSQKRIWLDYQESQLDQTQLKGHYVFIFRNRDQIRILTDPLCTLHTYHNSDASIISSSFLASIAASPQKLSLDRLALCEKISTGYIIGPNTLVNEIKQTTPQTKSDLSSRKNGLELIACQPIAGYQMHSGGLENSLQKQFYAIEEYFQHFDQLHLEHGGDLGVSDGFDSRLLLAASKFLTKPLTLHTHATQSAHETSQRIAADLANRLGQTLHTIPTRHKNVLSNQELDELAKTGLYLFDGRNAHSVGTLGETQTPQYKLRSLGDSRLSLNGLGGEMYRNHYNTQRRFKFSRDDWMLCHDFFPFAEDLVGDQDLFQGMMKTRNRKIDQRLNSENTTKADFLWTRRFYSEVRVPDCDCNNGDALNKLMLYLAPFADPKLISECLNGTPYIGQGGSYQAQLIKALNPSLAKGPPIESFQLHRPLPRKTKGKLLLQEHVPCSQIRKRRKRKLESLAKNNNAIQEDCLLQKRTIAGAIEALLSHQAIQNTHGLMLHYAQGPNALFVGEFLREFSPFLK